MFSRENKMREIVKKILPQRIKNRIRTFWGWYLLRGVKSIKPEFRNLRFFDKKQVENIFNLEYINKDWEKEQDKIQSLKIPENAGINNGDRRAVYSLVRFLKPGSVLEIGTKIGSSTVHIGLAMMQNKNSKKLITLDIKDYNDNDKKLWKEHNSKYCPQELVKKVGAEKIVEFRVEDSVGYLKNCNQKIDFVFIDGSHRAKEIYQEVSIISRLLNPGGIILLHDYFPNNKPLWSNKSVIPGPYLALRRLFKEGLNLTIIPLENLPWKTRPDSNRTSLALLSS